jgi:hypothetical protein
MYKNGDEVQHKIKNQNYMKNKEKEYGRISGAVVSGTVISG